MKPLRLLLLASGQGSHVANLIDATRDGRIEGRVTRVVTDRADAPALERARERGITAEVLPESPAGSRLARDAEDRLLAIAREDRPDLVALCGFMRLLRPETLQGIEVPVLNVHPSLLPRFRGLNAQRQAIEAGAAVTGATVHVVDSGMDTGPVLLQAELPIRPGETAEELSARLLPLEHRLYVEAIRTIQQGVTK
ncbi:MAG TPA: phosphoribosylglycinamide formyltransferase [Candidatus Eisenbacteria bacterium]|nr:phosphoribosylglycinamide formyltransferase [Candidatus Eisenbacteria bacterium]